LSTTYKTVAGDDFATIARKVYGDASLAGHIAAANPGAAEPLTAGIYLVAPEDPNAPQDAIHSTSATVESEISIAVGGSRLSKWQSVKITRSMDTFDTVSFSAPFDPDSSAVRGAFRPFSYQAATVTVGGARLFTGTLISVEPELSESDRTVTAGCYSKPAVLNDCQASAADYPVEFEEQTLRAIAQKLAKPFGVNVVFEAEEGAPFEPRVAIEPTETVFGFLVKLARAQNLVVASTAEGALRFWKSAGAGSPAASLQEGLAPLIKVTPTFSPQSYYSHITGIGPTLLGSVGKPLTTKNPHLTSPLRPHVFTAMDAEDAQLPAAVDAKIGRMFGNMASYSVDVASWRTPAGALWAPNTTVRVYAPGAMIYQPYSFLLRSVDFMRDAKSETARLHLVMPGAFSGEIPGSLPWEG